MNTRTSTILIAGALIAAASTLSAQAADQDPTAREAKPVTLHEAQESDWFARERILGSTSFAPVPFPVPPAAPAARAMAVKPITLHQAEESDWFARERALGSGTFAPVPFPIRPAAPVVASSSRPAPTSQTADNKWWTQEQALDDGHVWPLPSASNAETVHPTNASR
jgi:hypothetical protein